MEQLMKEIIGYSDYSRTEIVNSDVMGYFSSNPSLILSAVHEFEKCGWKVRFETSMFRRLFLMAKYKIVATKVIVS